MNFMRSSLKEFLYGREKEICNEIMRLMVKYDIEYVFRDETFLLKSVMDINYGIFNESDENITLIVQKVSTSIIKKYNKSDLMEKVYDIIKCFENGYRIHLLNNIENKEVLNECIVYIDQFFYLYEKQATKMNWLVYGFNLFIKKEEINDLINSIPAIVILKDANEKWICANRYAEKFYNLGEDYIGKTDRELSMENDYIKESICSSHKSNAWTSNKTYFYEESITKDNKNTFLFVTEVSMIFQNSNKFIVVIKSDITKNKIMEKKIQDNENNYIKIFQNISDCVFICKGNSLLYLNKKAMKLIGQSKIENVAGKDLNYFLEVSPKSIQGGKYNVKKLIYEEEDIASSNSVKRKSDGKIFDMDILRIPFLYENQNTILVIARNIDTKDSMIKYSKSKSEFIGKISHELRTPLNVILSALQVIGFYNECKDQKEQCRVYNKYYYMIKQNSYRLLRIVNNFMDVNEIEDGVSKLSFTRENIISIVEDVTMAAAAFIGDKGKSIVFDTDVEEKVMLVDKDGIQKVILNLLSNAIKFTDKDGEIKVNVHDDNESITISVKDNGIGIPEGKQKVIFERFVQLDKTFTRKREGSGIGLLIVKMIVKLHNGTIKVNSKPGYGSEFIVTLPVINSTKLESQYQENVIKLSNEEKVNLEFSDLML